MRGGGGGLQNRREGSGKQSVTPTKRGVEQLLAILKVGYRTKDFEVVLKEI